MTDLLETIRTADASQQRELIERVWLEMNPEPTPRGYRNREWLEWVCPRDRLLMRLQYGAYESAVISMKPDHLRLVVLCELPEGDWAAKFCVREPHKAMPTEGAATPALALLAAIVAIGQEATD